MHVATGKGFLAPEKQPVPWLWPQTCKKHLDFGVKRGKPASPGPSLYAWDLSCFAPHRLSSRQHSPATARGFPEVVGAKRALGTHGFN